MHGNTRTSSAYPGVKTRHMHDIVSEISASLRIHASMGSRLGGVHLELTGDITEDGLSVTECLGGSMRLEEEELGLRFESYCDRALPLALLSCAGTATLRMHTRAARLNFEQALGAPSAFRMSDRSRADRLHLPAQTLPSSCPSRPVTAAGATRASWRSSSVRAGRRASTAVQRRRPSRRRRRVSRMDN